MNATTPVAIHHFTHLDNLPGIIAQGMRSDSACKQAGLTEVEIGSSAIRQRRLHLPIDVGPGGSVGDYVPFYYAPRSPMMYTLNRNNYEFQQGFDEVVYLTTTLETLVSAGVAWVASDRNAALGLAAFTDDYKALGAHIRWDVMRMKYWSDVPAGADLRAAELLAHDRVPWQLVLGVTTRTAATKAKVLEALEGVAHQPQVDVRPGWYF